MLPTRADISIHIEIARESLYDRVTARIPLGIPLMYHAYSNKRGIERQGGHTSAPTFSRKFAGVD